MAEWALELGDEFERSRIYLRSSGVNAVYYPCTNRFPCGCRHRVESVRRGGWVAVCDCGGCQPIRLGETDIRVFEPDVARLAEAVLKLCGWEVQIRPTSRHGVWQVGSFGDARTPVFWWAGNGQEHLRRALDELVNSGAAPFALLAPTRTHLSLRIEAMLKREGCVAVALADLVVPNERGELGLKGSPDAVRRELEMRAADRRDASELLRTLHKKLDASTPSTPVNLDRPQRYVFQKAGSSWKVAFEGRPEFNIGNTFGAQYLDYLLHRPNQLISAFDLEVAVRPEKANARRKTSIQNNLDADAVKDYLRELNKLRAKREKASEEGAHAEVERLDDNIEAIEQELKKNGQVTDAGERARGNVSKAIAAVRRNLLRGNRDEKALGEHIKQFVNTGYECIYNQSEGRIWR